MKKVLAAFLLLALLFSASPAYAANQTSGESIITFTSPDPSFMIIIPPFIQLGEEGADVPVEAINVVGMGGYRISVTVAGTQDELDRFLLDGKTSDGDVELYYELISSTGEPIVSDLKPAPYNIGSNLGKELTSFTEDGKEFFKVLLDIVEGEGALVPGAKYSGTLYYGVSVVEL